VPHHPFEPPRGRVEQFTFDGASLRDNRLGDPSRRTVGVYLPEGYDAGADEYPLLVDLAPFTSSGLKHLGWQAFGESLPQRLDRLIASTTIGPVVVAFPDGFTSLGGNQYVDSPVLGRWESWLIDDLLPELERRYRVRRGPRHRAIFGRSSGGYGALIQGLRHGEQWAAVACHSGDIGFDLVYRRDLPALLDELARHEGGIERFLDHARTTVRLRPHEMQALMMLALAASFDPDIDADLETLHGIRLPLDGYTGELDPERWRHWLAHDPLVIVERLEAQRSLKSLRGLYIDCGRQDAYFLHYGARSLSRRLTAAGIAHTYEEFDDGHSGIDYRLDVSLPFLYRCVTAPSGDSRSTSAPD
jgi:hypothetical protein